MQEPDTRQELDNIVRHFASAGKTLRLYPANSPMPKQAVALAAQSLDSWFAQFPVLSLALVREGFSFHGEPVALGAVGASDLADALKSHGVAELAIMPGCTGDELLTFLNYAMQSPEEIRDQGGLSTLLAANGVEAIRVTDVHLTVIEQTQLAPEGDIDEFLRELARDPDKLAAWLAAASAGDPATFQEGLAELAAVSGPEGMEQLLKSLAGAFNQQTAEGKDALLGLAFEPGVVRDMTGGMFGLLGSADIASALTDGNLGKNMLSLSNALTGLPLAEKIAEVKAEVQAMLPGAGHTSKEGSFLEHMVDVRTRVTPEPSLVDADQVYRQVVAATRVSAEDVDRMRSAVVNSASALNAASVNTMLTLLDQQRDYSLYTASLENLASMVPRLLESGELGLASRVIGELAAREARAVQPWPDLTQKFRDTIALAVGPRSMAALMRSAVADQGSVSIARDIVQAAGDSAGPALIGEAIALKAEGLAMAEELMGRRVVPLLQTAAMNAQWFQLAPIAERLAREGDNRSLQVVDHLLKRPDEQSRREVVTGLGAASTPAAVRLLSVALRDPSAEVAISAIRALGKSGAAGSGDALAHRLEELDLDGKDFVYARELIAALSRCHDASAGEALHKLASKKALIKRGHFEEVKAMAEQGHQRWQGSAR